MGWPLAVNTQEGSQRLHGGVTWDRTEDSKDEDRS
jgi:hypothetical protein